METNPGIEKQVEETLNTVKAIGTVEPSAGFTERTMYRIKTEKAGSVLSASSLLKAAAILVLICLNALTIKHVLEPVPAQQPATVSATMDDLVKEYQVADISNEWLINKPVQNEQP